MKKILSLLLACAMLLCCTTALGETEIIVFAAASMTETVSTIKAMYEAENPGVVITCNFDSSGTLKTQIEEGAECDIFISAAQKQMNALDANCEGGADVIDPETRINLLENKVTLAVPEGNPAAVESFTQVMEMLKNGQILLAIGNSDVPVGQYTQKIFAFYGIDETAVAANLTYGSNVKEVTTQVAEASVDCGIIYGTDAYSAGLNVVDEATAEMCGGQVIYPAAVLKSAGDAEAARAFLAYLQSEEASDVFASVGFSPMMVQAE